jgi:hypothetical protein
MHSAISDPVLDRHIELTITEIVAQLDHAESFKTRAKTGYYKVAIVLTVSILEALLYHYIERAVAKDPALTKHPKVRTTNHVHAQDLGTLNKYLAGSGHEFCMHRIEETDFELTHRTNLSMLTNFCYATGLIGKQLKDGIEYAQSKRNQIHLQGLTTTSYKYNGKMIDRIIGTMLKVYTKIEGI